MSPSPEYRTSTHCGSASCADGACVEVGFETSSFCGSSACVEVDRTSNAPHILVRDSKDLSIAPLVFTTDEWRDFIKGAKDGEFDV